MIARQSIRAGSEEHKRMMEKVIRHIQAQGNFAFVPSNKDAPDVVMLPVHHETKGVWDFDCLCVYECQTNAIPTEIAKCVERRKAYDATLTVIVDNEEVRQQVKSVTCDITCHCVGELVLEGEKA